MIGTLNAKIYNLDSEDFEVANEKEFRLREAILMSKQIGRPLSQEEMKEFEV